MIREDNELHWYLHDGRLDGTANWAFAGGTKVGTGWGFKPIE